MGILLSQPLTYRCRLANFKAEMVVSRQVRLLTLNLEMLGWPLAIVERVHSQG